MCAINVDIAIIGGGPAGLAAAIGAKEEGIENVIILERDAHLGGILNQCIHNGFGLHTFKEELTGPEYACRYIDKVNEMGITVKLNTMVININENKEIIAVNEAGIMEFKAKSIILAMGCRERSRGSINIPGSRAVGVFTAGTAQKFVNLDGYLPGKEVVILGSGDIGLIMARRMSFEGAKVKAVVELMPHSSGLNRNIVQCLDDFDIPLKLSHTITHIKGKERVEGVTIVKVDENRVPIIETEEFIPCDTVLLSVGLLPENELSKQANVKISSITGGPNVNQDFQTSIEGIFACGNVLHVHDLVDFVSEESVLAGKHAAKYIKNGNPQDQSIHIEVKNGIRYAVPSYIQPQVITEDLRIKFRVDRVYKNRNVCVYINGEQQMKRRVRILAPGEMETIVLKKKWLEKFSQITSITLTTEEVKVL